MMRKPIDSNVLVRVARLYYIEKKTQAEIAEELGIGRSMISIMLGQAKERGIVEITYHIKDPQLNKDEYSKEIERFAKLDNCFVVPYNRKNSEFAVKLINERAEAYIDERLEDDCLFGIASGFTCFEFMKSYIPKIEVSNITTIPLVGGSSRTNYDLQLNEMVRAFSERIHGIPVYIFAPDMATDIADKELYMKSSQMQLIADKWGNLDIAVVGIGATPDFPQLGEDQITAETLDEFLQKTDMPVSDICARQLNMRGEVIDSDYNRNIMSVPLEDLKNAKNVVAMASGVNKAFSIIAALRAGVIKTLVLDEKTAKAVLAGYHLFESGGKKSARKQSRSIAEKKEPDISQVRALMSEYDVESIDDIKDFIKTLTEKVVEETLDNKLKGQGE